LLQTTDGKDSKTSYSRDSWRETEGQEILKEMKDSLNKDRILDKEEAEIIKKFLEKIKKEIIKNSCVICGTNTDIICDHKNDLYNDIRVLNTSTQELNDFQPLCNHCNLQKRQICKNEEKTQRIYSAKNIIRYKKYNFEFPWEKKIFDKNDINCKKDTYWFDPVEFENKIYCYLSYVIPILNEIKRIIKSCEFP
jgi:hypothetical protein